MIRATDNSSTAQANGGGDDEAMCTTRTINRRTFLAVAGTSVLGVPQALQTAEPAGSETRADVVVYGATPSGIMAAIAAKRQGASVLLIAPGTHIGGTMSGGLSRTDLSGRENVGGLAQRFLNDVASQTPDIGKPWDLEPHIAMDTFTDWLRRNEITLWRNRRLDSVECDGSRLQSIELADGSHVAGKCFVDATYEGDLMAKSGISYTVGRESRDTYGEPHAGWHQYPAEDYSKRKYREPGPELGGKGARYMHNNQFGARIPARDENGDLLWGVHASEPRAPGIGDGKLQAYCFRLCVTEREELRVPWPKPDHYYPERYELLLRYIQAHPGMSWHALLHLSHVSKHKYDMNASGPFTIDYVGGGWGGYETDRVGAGWNYPEADFETRRRIVQDHEDYQKGFLWFLAHDPRVPEKIRDEASRWGLCKDEFVENDHWPPQLYIREARRMTGRYVMTEQDVTKDVKKSDAIGRGSFGADSHPVQRFEAEDGAVEEEGHFFVGTSSYYHIPYRSITPKQEECENLLVPVCLSASHVAFGSIRMEPVYMLLGHSTGVGAAMAAADACSVQEIDVAALQQTLEEQGQVL